MVLGHYLAFPIIRLNYSNLLFYKQFENPRVGGSIPTLATIFTVKIAGTVICLIRRPFGHFMALEIVDSRYRVSQPKR